MMLVNTISGGSSRKSKSSNRSTTRNTVKRKSSSHGSRKSSRGSRKSSGRKSSRGSRKSSGRGSNSGSKGKSSRVSSRVSSRGSHKGKSSRGSHKRKSSRGSMSDEINPFAIQPAIKQDLQFISFGCWGGKGNELCDLYKNDTDVSRVLKNVKDYIQKGESMPFILTLGDNYYPDTKKDPITKNKVKEFSKLSIESMYACLNHATGATGAMGATDATNIPKIMVMGNHDFKPENNYIGFE